MQTSINQIMNTSGVKFGTSGARGLVVDMSDYVCFAYTIGFLQHAAASGTTFDKVAVAYDLRESSPRIAAAVRCAVRHFGLTPVDCQTVPTPTIALYGMTQKIPSIMITGSHIPEDRNGIKFHFSTGEILKSDEAAIRQRTVEIPDDYFDSNGMLKSEHADSQSETDNGEAAKIYINRFVQAFPPDFLSGFRIGLYEHSSVARDILYDLYTKLGASVTRLGRSDVFVAVDTEAVRDEDIYLAKSWASGNELPEGIPISSDGEPIFDAILSTDGDGDRPLVFDELGNWIRGDLAGILTSRFLLADCVVTSVNSNTALEKTAWFSKIIRTKIGSPYVVEAMQNAVVQGCKRVVAYEANGGFLTANSMLIDEDQSRRPLTALPTRDSALVHLAMLGYARQTNTTLSDLVGHLPRRIVMSDRLKSFSPEIAKQKIEELTSGGEDMIQLLFASFGELQTVDMTDGLRMTFGEQDIVHLRPSGNAPELRCYTEADTKERAASLLYRTMTILDSWRRRDQQDTYPYRQS